MFPALKKSLIPLAVLALVLAGAATLRAPTARADLDGTGAGNGVWFLDSYGITGSSQCDDGDLREVRVFDQGLGSQVTNDDPLQVIQIASDDDIIMCVNPADGGLGGANVVFDTSGGGEWNDAACGDNGGGGDFVEFPADACTDEEGVGDDALTVVGAGNDMTTIAVTFSCNGASVQTITIDQDDADDEVEFRIMCKGRAENVSISATPTTVESDPAAFNTAFSLIRVVITDAAGNPVLPGTDVDFKADRCTISSDNVDTLEERNEVLFNEGVGPSPIPGVNLQDIDAEFGTPPLENYVTIAAYSLAGGASYGATTSMDAIEVDTNAFPDDEDGGNGDGVPNHSEALAILNALGCDPGPVVVSVEVDGGGPDAEGEITVNVIGPPAFITVVAAPTELICGEKAEITISATDALNQGVSDFTAIEVVTNFGGVVAGTGTSLLDLQPVNPLSSTTAILYDGSATAYLLTSDKHIGSYEVLAAHRSTGDEVTVVNQVTVTCTDGVAPTITPPDTGTGEIRPPNTGDAGLATGSAGGTLLAIAGATLVALALIARTRFGHD